MRRSGVRIPLAPPQADIRSGCRFFVCLGVLSRWCVAVAPLVFWAPEGPAAREARRPHFVRRRASKPARALRSLRRPPHRRRLVADVRLGVSSRSPARPRHRPRAPQPGPAGTHRHRVQAMPSPAGTAAWPSGPSGALHTGRAWCLEARPGPATATGSVGDSGETVIAFAGVCFVFGETQDTIAWHTHPFSALFWCAKASWVSCRRPEVPALVLTVSSRGAVSSMGATKFAQHDLSMAIAR